MNEQNRFSSAGQGRALGLSTVSIAACFAVWTLFAIIGIPIRAEFGLNDIEFGLLVAMPVLTGSLSRLFLGVWTETYGARLVFALQMLLTSAAVWFLTYAKTYPMFLLAGAGFGLAGGATIIGVAYASCWQNKGRPDNGVNILGAGSAGAALTSFIAPVVLLANDWQGVAQVWAICLAGVALLFFLLAKEDPEHTTRRGEPAALSLTQKLAPLKNLQVWRFSLYYFFVFGAFVALVLWMPHYMIEVYDMDMKSAGMATGFFVLSASLFRVYGGRLVDRFGARSVMYWSFGFSLLLLLMLTYPPTNYVIQSRDGGIAFSTRMTQLPFVFTLFGLGFFLSMGEAAVFKHIPAYYSNEIGAVVGLVGMIGGLGGFVLPVAFGVLLELTGVYTTCFFLLFLLVAIALTWMHMSVRAMERTARGPELDRLPELPEMASIHEPDHPAMPKVLEEWHPEDSEFWSTKGRAVARRNLWISIPCLLLSFSVWMVWSVVVARLPAIGFGFAPGQLFWLAALPGLSGATLRIFYSFMVPIFGGRLWTMLSTASLLLPAMGIGYAVQDPETPYFIFLVLALLCGFGGGNFASSMANIAFFYPKAEKGNALALNAGLGNLGVSVMQFLVPIAITAGVFGTVAGQPQTMSEGGQLWMQNAGFVWVPFIIAATAAAWLGMNDIADAKASFREQAVIFSRKQNWLMCILYTGTFGSFIGYSAGFPLLTRLMFPEVNALQYVFLGPLVGALSRAGTGWISDRFGGGRVTFWTFIGMIVAVFGVISFLPGDSGSGNFWAFFACFMALFLLTGVGNASTFQMIPAIMNREIPRLMPELDSTQQRRQIERESAAIIAFTSAIAAYGAFFIPKAYGSSIAMTGSPVTALWAFLIFYAICVVLTWATYTRRDGLLYEVERGHSQQAARAG